MKSTLLVVAGLALAANCFAGSETIIRERAKELRDQNNVRQGVAPPSAPPAPATTPATPSQTLTPQQSILVRLQSDMGAIKAAPTDEQKQKLARDLTAASMGPVKPTQASISKLASSLATALGEKTLTPEVRGRLLQDLHGALNGASLPPTQMDAIVSDTQAIFQTAGVSRTAAAAVAADLKKVAAEIQKPAATK
jgi:hypothetical protein